MLHKNVLLLIIALCSSTLLFAQDNPNSDAPNGFNINHNFGVAVASNFGATAVSLSWVHMYGIGKRKNLRVGYGVRFNSFFGRDLAYSLAPASLQAEGLTDTLSFASAQANNLAITFNAAYRIKKFELGFNIDALGLGFGGTKTATYATDGFDANQDAKPTTASVLLVGARDIGTLNSEFSLGYWLSNNLQLRLGLNMFFSEYTTNNVLAHDNNRFRNISQMPFIAVGFSPGRN